MRRALLAAALLLAAAPAWAQSPGRDPAADPVAHLVRQWQARVVMDGNVAGAIDQALAALRQSRAELARAQAELAALKEKCGAPCQPAETPP